MKLRAIALFVGILLDLWLGDPRWFPHPIIAIGKLISFLDRKLRRIFPKTKGGEIAAGGVLWILTVAVSFCLPFGVLSLAYGLWMPLGVAAESVLCWQILAAKSLKTESMKVYTALKTETIADARYAVSMIVGRDTAELTATGVAKAAVETVAENASDGVIAPMLFFALGGAPLALAYKAVNTMDSMVGYVEMPYKNIGLIPAKMDDIFNFLPARICAVLMLSAGGLLGLNFRNGVKIFRRDRYNHASPNSAQTESVCAGLLGLQLAGDASYHGVLHKKPFIGDALRPITAEDIPLANRLMYATAALCAVVCLALLVFLPC